VLTLKCQVVDHVNVPAVLADAPGVVEVKWMLYNFELMVRVPDDVVVVDGDNSVWKDTSIQNSMAKNEVI
jgi:hypothetical protein